MAGEAGFYANKEESCVLFRSVATKQRRRQDSLSNGMHSGRQDSLSNGMHSGRQDSADVWVAWGKELLLRCCRAPRRFADARAGLL
eukprot:1282634-Pleurochrysis_carterae.AAC.1